MKKSAALLFLMLLTTRQCKSKPATIPLILPNNAVTSPSNVYSVAISPNEKYFAAGAYSEVIIWSAEGNLLQTLRFVGALPGVWVRALAFSSDGTKIAAIGVDDGIRVWETETGKPLFQLPDHQKGALCVAFSPDGSMIATGGNDKAVRLWDAETGVKLQDLKIHEFPVRKLCFSRDGKTLVSLGAPLPHVFTLDEQVNNVEFARWDITDVTKAALKFG